MFTQYGGDRQLSPGSVKVLAIQAAQQRRRGAFCAEQKDIDPPNVALFFFLVASSEDGKM